MNKFNLLLVYILTVYSIFVKLHLPFTLIDQTIGGWLFSALSIVLMISNLNIILGHKYGKLILVYIFALILSYQLIQEKSFSNSFLYVTPIFIALIANNNPHKYRFLYYAFIGVFLINVGAAFYERLTLNYIVPIKLDDEVLQSQFENYGNRDDAFFRSFAFFGHPLTNGNIMAFMSFIILYTKSIRQSYRIILFLLGIASLFCFNTRGAIIISLILLLPSLYLYIKNDSKYKILAIIFCVVLAVYFIQKFAVFGGRLVDNDLMDDSALARLMTWNEYLNLSWSEKLFGGSMLSINENGYLEVLAEFGLILGGLKIFTEVFLAYKLVKNESVITKAILMLSLIAIGSTNNNLSYPVVFPMYILALTFIHNLNIDNRVEIKNRKNESTV